jgi:putative lipoprotein
VTGTVSYRQRIALTPDAIVEVKLLDVSRADGPATTVAEQTIKPAGRQVPIAFELQYDPARINQRSRYAIQARILEGGQVRFANSQAYPVITGGRPKKVNVIVNPVPH